MDKTGYWKYNQNIQISQSRTGAREVGNHQNHVQNEEKLYAVKSIRKRENIMSIIADMRD